MEKPLIKSMRENYGYFGSLSLIYGVLFAFCFYRNTHGVTIVLYAVITIVFALLYMKKINFKLQKKSKRYFIGMIFLSMATCLTTEMFFITFNFIGISLLFSIAMIHQYYNDEKWNFPAYLERLFILIGTTAAFCFYPFKHGVQYLSGTKQGKKRTVLAVLTGLLFSLGLISIILPLLLSSDMVFAKFFGEILKHINFWTLSGIGILIIVGFVAFYAFYAALCSYNFPSEKERKLKYYNPVVGITFTSVLAVIYIAYSGIQILYLFMGVSKGLPESVTYSEYARSGFWELLFVAVINFVLVLVCMYVYAKSNILKGILSVISFCTYIMMISAAYRMLIYITQYHLTFLRLLVLWVLFVLSLIMIGVVISIYRESFPLFRYIVTVVSICYIGFAFGRPGYWVAEYNVTQMKNMTVSDLNYLMIEFPEDAAAAISRIDPEDINTDSYSYNSEGEDVNQVKGRLYDYYSLLSENNQGIFFRKANYVRIRARMIADKYLEENKAFAQYSMQR